MDGCKALSGHAKSNPAFSANAQQLTGPGYNSNSNFRCAEHVVLSKWPMQENSTWEMLSLEQALSLMEPEANLLSVENYIWILQKCRKRKNLAYAKLVHMHIYNNGLEAHRDLGNYLVPMFVECGSMLDAQVVFDKLAYRNEYAWTSLIQGYVDSGELWHALNLFQQMQDNYVYPSRYTYVAVLKACARLKCQERGRFIHHDITKEGLERDPFVCSTLVDMYAKCGSLAEAQEVFNDQPVQDVVSYTALISGYAENGLSDEALICLDEMHLEGVHPNVVTFICCLKACCGMGALDSGRELHIQIVKAGLERELFVCSTLVDMYARCGSLGEAQNVFDELPIRDLVLWTALMTGYFEHGLCEEVLTCLERMELEGVSPDAVTVACGLRACAAIGALCNGREMHAEVAKEGWEIDPFVGEALVDMYAKCGSLVEAQKVFDDLQVQSVVLWTILTAGYADHRLSGEALNCIEQMYLEGMCPDSVTYICGLKACGSLRAIHRGREIHIQIAKDGFERDPFVYSSLVDMYAKCGFLAEAQYVLEKQEDQDIVLWTALITGYTEHGLGEEALNCLERMQLNCVSPNAGAWTVVISGYADQGETEKALKLYLQMQEQSVIPDKVTFLTILKACGNTAALETGKKIHAQTKLAGGLEANEVVIANGLIAMYAKCGSMVDGRQVFDAMPTRDVVTWTVLISGYAQQGESETVFQIFERMEEEGIRPDGVTFLSVLAVCSHVGLVDKGHKYFDTMRTVYGISPTIEHQNSMIDLLGRAGQLDEAVTIMEKMHVKSDLVGWMTILSACCKCNNADLGEMAFEFALRLDENDAAAYILMSNIYVHAHM